MTNIVENAAALDSGASLKPSVIQLDQARRQEYSGSIPELRAAAELPEVTRGSLGSRSDHRPYAHEQLGKCSLWIGLEVSRTALIRAGHVTDQVTEDGVGPTSQHLERREHGS